MKIAILSVTNNGAEWGQKLLKALMPENQCVIYEKKDRQSGKEAVLYERIRPLLKDIWENHDAFIFIMSVGIVVRDISPFLRHKSLDPAVVVMDERGFNCISLLSGHLGGANDLTRKVAELSGANPVITTASDINGLVVPDAIAKKLGYDIESYAVLKKVNGCIVAQERVYCFIDDKLPEKDDFIIAAQKLGMEFSVLKDGMTIPDAEGLIYLSEYGNKLPFKNTLYLRPKSIIAGIGCKRGSSEQHIKNALKEALAELDINIKCVKAVCSAWVKSDEEGLVSLAGNMRVPVHFYDKEILEETIDKHDLEKSDFAEKQIGVGNVCEAAAMSYAKEMTLIKGKTAYQGVTVALARANFLLQG